VNKFILLCLILTGCVAETYREEKLESEYTSSNQIVAKGGVVSDFAYCDNHPDYPDVFVRGGCWVTSADPNFHLTTSEIVFNQYGRPEGWFCEGNSNNPNDNHTTVVVYATCNPQ
jgi:hypothetical protein